MLELVCYLVAMVLLGLAAILPATVPHRDRLAYAGLCPFTIPFFVHAVQAH
ncbi:hypothetical protein ACIO6U_02635 [Streptomyces sp. NPDC087422]|uniref:hypothetical protein n=1 Tax=Streptomyces sp. NPDC087422 TaxID=3365786 RepID=UPI0038130545